MVCGEAGSAWVTTPRMRPESRAHCTSNPVMAVPPVSAGGVQDTSAVVEETALIVGGAGAPGAVVSVVKLRGVDQGENPTLFCARTRTKYPLPFARPVRA